MFVSNNENDKLQVENTEIKWIGGDAMQTDLYLSAFEDKI